MIRRKQARVSKAHKSRVLELGYHKDGMFVSYGGCVVTATISPHHRLARRIQRAFHRGDLSDLSNLKDAMAWVNYMESGESRRSVARTFNALNDEALRQIPAKSVSTLIAVAGHCQGARTECAEEKFYWVKTINLRYEFELPDHPERASWLANPMRKKLIEYAKEDLDGDRERRVVWLSDFSGIDLEKLIAPTLIADLGMLGVQVNHNRRAIIITVKVNGAGVYKPTMIDSGFTFYWRAGPHSAKYGMTRSLRDNRPAHREWVIPKADVEIIDAWPLPVANVSLLESDLTPAFWEACRYEIEGKRP